MLKKIVIIILLLFSYSNLCIASGNPSDPGFVGPPAPSSSSPGGTMLDTSFTLDTNSFSVNNKTGNLSAEESMNDFFGTVIEKLTIGIGVVGFLIMVIGGGYMILYHGQDEYLSKGKGIFIAGLASIGIALSSYLLVSLVRYILYSIG